jgi:hypothetical protein
MEVEIVYLRSGFLSTCFGRNRLLKNIFSSKLFTVSARLELIDVLDMREVYASLVRSKSTVLAPVFSLPEKVLYGVQHPLP